MRAGLLLLCLAVLQGGCRASEPLGCQSPDTLRVAEEALEQINQDRSSGYILSLSRVYDLAHTAAPERGGSLYKLTLDVMETRCHITSRKPWKQCEVRRLSDVPAYGECEVSAFFGSQVELQSYSCALREVPATAVVDVCPDCPTADNLNEPIVKETSNLSLQRFNEESTLANYFSLGEITRASSQWVVGPSYFVEFTIVETVCSKENNASDLSSCSPMDRQSARRGFCLGSHTAHDDQFEIRLPAGKKHGSFQNQNPVEVKCEIYEPQAAAEHQHHNHTHLHPDQHSQAVPAGSGRSVLGAVVQRAPPVRAAPAASSCPGPHTHSLGLSKLRL